MKEIVIYEDHKNLDGYTDLRFVFHDGFNCMWRFHESDNKHHVAAKLRVMADNIENWSKGIEE